VRGGGRGGRGGGMGEKKRRRSYFLPQKLPFESPPFDNRL